MSVGGDTEACCAYAAAVNRVLYNIVATAITATDRLKVSLDKVGIFNLVSD